MGIRTSESKVFFVQTQIISLKENEIDQKYHGFIFRLMTDLLGK